MTNLKNVLNHKFRLLSNLGASKTVFKHFCHGVGGWEGGGVGSVHVILRSCVCVIHLIIQFHVNHVQWLKVKNSGGTLGNQTWHTNGWLQRKLPKFSILSAKFDCPVAHQKFSLLATGHDCETG